MGIWAALPFLAHLIGRPNLARFSGQVGVAGLETMVLIARSSVGANPPASESCPAGERAGLPC